VKFHLEQLNTYQQQLQQFMTVPNGISPTINNETQTYLQYCYTHYQMYQNFLASQTPVSSITTVPSNPASASSAAAAATPPPPQPAPAPAAAAAPPPPNNNNNNNIEPDHENDLLGTLHMLAELFVLCSIIYFYSTFNRFLVVFVIFILLYLHYRGFLSLQRRRRAQVQPPVVPVEQEEQQQPPPPATDAEQQPADDEPEADAAPPLAPNEPQNPNDLQRPQPPPLVPVDNQITTTRLLVTAISTFFSSLIPERPQRM